MRKNFGKQDWLYPQPVLIIGTYDENGKPNAMNAAWGGTYNDHQVFIRLSPHKTTENILKNKAFTLTFADAKHVVEADYVGIVSGSDTPDKMEKAGFHAVKSEFVNAPIFEEFPLHLECKLYQVLDDGGIIGEIVNVSADESILVEGRPDTSKFDAIIFDPVRAEYRVLGKKVGDAFRDGAKLN